MESKVWIYFSKTGTGYEMSGSDIISGIDAFLLKEGTYLIEYCHSELIISLFINGTILKRNVELFLRDIKKKRFCWVCLRTLTNYLSTLQRRF